MQLLLSSQVSSGAWYSPLSNQNDIYWQNMDRDAQLPIGNMWIEKASFCTLTSKQIMDAQILYFVKTEIRKIQEWWENIVNYDNKCLWYNPLKIMNQFGYRMWNMHEVVLKSIHMLEKVLIRVCDSNVVNCSYLYCSLHQSNLLSANILIASARCK